MSRKASNDVFKPASEMVNDIHLNELADAPCPSLPCLDSRPFSLSIQPRTAFAKLSYGKRDFAEAEGRKTEIEERCMRRRRGGGRGKKFNAGPEGRNLAKETENQRGFA